MKSLRSFKKCSIEGTAESVGPGLQNEQKASLLPKLAVTAQELSFPRHRLWS
jgi:hypothetical protein